MTPKDWKLPVIPIDEQIKFIEQIDNCEETHAILESLQFIIQHKKKTPDRPVVICLTPEKARRYNEWDQKNR